MKKAVYIFFLSLLAGNVFSQENADVRISVLTCAPGDELYTAFGHSAIRVKIPSRKIDYVYNYGTFNFNVKNFYLKFARGQLDYQLSVSPFKHFVYSYMKENRYIIEQILNLTDDQKIKLADSLQINSLPENMTYRYDFIEDNCATRVKDIIHQVFKDEIIMGESDKKEKITTRQLILRYLDNREWGRFGINLALGAKVDKPADENRKNFLPDYLFETIKNSKIIQNGVEKPLVNKTHYLFKPAQEKLFKSTAFKPFIFALIILSIVIIFSFIELHFKKNYPIIDFILFFIVGLTGLVSFLLWTATEHHTTVQNFNVIWAVPLHLFFAFTVFRKEIRTIPKYYFLIYSAYLTLFTVILPFIPWHLDVVSIILIPALIIRAFLLYYKNSKN